MLFFRDAPTPERQTCTECARAQPERDVISCVKAGPLSHRCTYWQKRLASQCVCPGRWAKHRLRGEDSSFCFMEHYKTNYMLHWCSPSSSAYGYKWDDINIYVQICKELCINWLTTDPPSPVRAYAVSCGSSSKVSNELQNNSINGILLWTPHSNNASNSKPMTANTCWELSAC